MSTEAFSETLQFITNVKLRELEKRREAFSGHASNVSAASSSEQDLIRKLSVLVEGMKDWQGKWSSNISREDILRWLSQAESDPGFPPSIIQNWIQQVEAEFEHERTRFEYAHLFGNLLTDWLKSSSSASRMEMDSPAVSGADGFEKVGRKETLEQKEKLESIIFEPKSIDVHALEDYLHDLFSSEKASEALKGLTHRIRSFAEHLRTHKILASDMSVVIRSALATDVLSDEKQTLLKQFAKNNTVVEELASVLTMQLQSLQTWSWPEEGVMVEPRRHLNGKTRFFLDAEILTCLLLHYIGMNWAMEFRSALEVLKCSSAWRDSTKLLTKKDLERREAYVGTSEDKRSIEGARKEYQSNHFFMCQLPDSLENSVNHYDDEESGGRNGRAPRSLGDRGPRFDTPIDLKQSLLHILSADILINETLRGSCTVVRTDLEWFGPSLPFDTVMTILRFFGMPEQELHFFQAFLSCPISFKDDPSGQIRTRKRGVPISYMLSTLVGELTMFIMDFAVNQKADGLFLYRIHDDFWFCDWNADRCATAWREMNRYASLAGLTFNASKTGAVCVGKGVSLHKGLPVGDVRWGFLKMNEKGVFVIDQDMIDTHVVEMRRQLAATTSTFSWTQAYNKYMAFVVRNCGQPVMVYGEAHLRGIVATLAKIQRALFLADGDSASGSFVVAIARMLEEKFGINTADIPFGWYVWPHSSGGLGVKDFFVDLFAMMDNYDQTPEEIIEDAENKDKWDYEAAVKAWNDQPTRRRYSLHPSFSSKDPFMPFEEFIKAREERSRGWYNAYMKLLKGPTKVSTSCTPQIAASISLLGEGLKGFGGTSWWDLSPYWQWVIGVHHDEMVRKFGSLAVVEAGSVPVGMVDVFKSSRMRWEQ